MKHLDRDSDHKAEGNNGKVTAVATEPFAETRYLKYQFERESIVLKAPESSGVYGLYSALWIYIGESDNIRARLLEHLAGDIRASAAGSLQVSPSRLSPRRTGAAGRRN